jgi:NAD(P)-dependent dehydrogenase (short-subunit alcohol dehydrogenase family)
MLKSTGVAGMHLNDKNKVALVTGAGSGIRKAGEIACGNEGSVGQYRPFVAGRGGTSFTGVIGSWHPTAMGRIVNIASISGKVSVPNPAPRVPAPTGPSKFALVGFTEGTPSGHLMPQFIRMHSRGAKVTIRRL